MDASHHRIPGITEQNVHPDISNSIRYNSVILNSVVSDGFGSVLSSITGESGQGTDVRL